MFLPILQKQKPKLSSVLRLPRNHKASKWQDRPQPGSLSAPAPPPLIGLRHRQVCIESKFDVLSFELNSVFRV